MSTREVLNLNSVTRDYLASPEHVRLMDYHPEVRIETRLERRLLRLKGSTVHLQKRS